MTDSPIPTLPAAGAPQPSLLMELKAATICRSWAGDTPGVTGVEWQVKSGDWWVVAGSADSGKSMLLATAAGLIRPWQGEHRLFGQELGRLTSEALLRERLRVGFTYEGGSRLLHRLTIAQNIALPLCYHRNWSPADAQATVNHLLALMELESVADRLPDRVHRHACQRASLARALVLQPELLLIDNPLTGLNPSQVRWWLDWLIQLAAGCDGLKLAPITLIVTAEDLRPWKDLALQFALLKERRWFLLGGREALAQNQDPLVREMLTENPAEGLG